jgi:hypothetical protein
MHGLFEYLCQFNFWNPIQTFLCQPDIELSLARIIIGSGLSSSLDLEPVMAITASAN